MHVGRLPFVYITCIFSQYCTHLSRYTFHATARCLSLKLSNHLHKCVISSSLAKFFTKFIGVRFTFQFSAHCYAMSFLFWIRSLFQFSFFFSFPSSTFLTLCWKRFHISIAKTFFNFSRFYKARSLSCISFFHSPWLPFVSSLCSCPTLPASLLDQLIWAKATRRAIVDIFYEFCCSREARMVGNKTDTSVMCTSMAPSMYAKIQVLIRE